MSAEIINFATRHHTPGARTRPAGTVTTTAKNARLRLERRKAWRRAEAFMWYWRTRLDFIDAASLASGHGLSEANAHAISHEARWSILDSYDEALFNLLLTPAPDMARLNWKRRKMIKMISTRSRYTVAKEEALEKAIDEDIVFLSEHPTRKPISRS